MYSICVDLRRCLALGALVLILAACGSEPDSPETRVREMVDAMQAAVERRSVQDAAALLASDYRDARHASKREAVATLFAYLRRNRQIHLFTLIDDLEVAAGRQAATASVLVAMAGVPLESLETVISLRADLYRFEMTLVQEGDDWVIGESSWQRVRPEGLSL